MKRIMPFLLLLFVTFSCSNSMLDSTDISICFDISQLSDNSVKVARNSTLVTDGKSYNEIKVKVTLYELNGSVDIPTEYSEFDASKYKQITEVQNYANTDGIVSVVLKEIPIGIKSFVVVEIYDEEGASPFYAGLSKVFEVLQGTNVVDIELKKKETSSTYTLTLIYPNNDESTCDYSQGDPADIPSEVPGYNLEGWYDNPDYEGEAISYIKVDKNITLYAKGTPIIYNISYILGDDANWITAIYPRTFSVEEVIELPTENALAKVGYTFEGWYKDADYKEKITSLVGLFEDITLYAKWRDENQVATVVMTPDSSKTVSYGTEVKLSCTTENSVIYYKVGEKATEYEEYTENSKIEITGETIIFAYATCEEMLNSEETQATYKLHQYTLKFVTNGGTDVESDATYFDGTTVHLDFLTTKDNMKFGGWFTTNDFSGNSIQSITFSQNLEFLNNSDNSITLYAKWNKEVTGITYANNTLYISDYEGLCIFRDIVNGSHPDAITIPAKESGANSLDCNARTSYNYLSVELENDINVTDAWIPIGVYSSTSS